MKPSRYRTPDPADPPIVMGILNVTPDSFSDGGRFQDPAEAVQHALQMIDAGAGIIDIGGESTRPGSSPVSSQEQIERTLPVIEAIRSSSTEVWLSIDTTSAEVAEAALRSGVDIVNDVSALRDDPQMGAVVAEYGAAVVLMHRCGQSIDMQRDGGPQYENVIDEIAAFFEDRRRSAVDCGVDASRIIFDPGIGFGKRVEHNLLILKHLDRFVSLGQPLLVGASRKSFIGEVLSQPSPQDRHNGSLACAAVAVWAGAAIIRAHDVGSTVEVTRLVHSIRRAGN